MKSTSTYAYSVIVLISISYWVCEKSDGVRVLVFVRQEDNTSAVYLVCPAFTSPPPAQAIVRLTDMTNIAWCRDIISHSTKTPADHWAIRFWMENLSLTWIRKLNKLGDSYSFR
jgi:hypothetical protein